MQSIPLRAEKRAVAKSTFCLHKETVSQPRALTGLKYPADNSTDSAVQGQPSGRTVNDTAELMVSLALNTPP